MATVNNDICEIVKKCKILLLDIEGTTTSISFVKDKLFIYAEENVKEFLVNQWENEEVKEAVAALRKLALEDEEKSVKGVVAIPGEESSKDDQIEGLVNNVKWQMLADRKEGALKQLQGLIWKLGYDKGDIKGHVYDDVQPALEQWKSTEGQKVYIYSSGSVQAQKLLFGQSTVGDLLPLIEGHFDTAVGAKQEAASYAAIVEKIGCKADEILFLTDIIQEAEAARASGLHAALVTRDGNKPLPTDAAATYPVLQSFEQLHPVVSNKRKTDDQVEELPAKVPKTDGQEDVKTTIEAKEAVSDAEVPATVEATPKEPVVPEPVPETAEPEKMEVEEQAEPETKKPEEVVEKSPAQVETVVEEVTEAMDADVPVSDATPVVEETKDKTEEVETVKSEAKAETNGETATEPKEPANEEKKEAPVAEETPVITEIEEVTGNLNEVADIIEDLVPVVEEPPSEDMEELQNVGEVLEKECDEILSKVQNVTNLDSIPIKPILNTITEETMETENTDSNDIVDRILDTEIEMGIKAEEDIDLNTVQEIKDTKTEVVEENKEANKEVTGESIEDKPTENVVEAKDVPKDSTADSNKEEVKEDKPISNGDTEANSVPAQVKVPEIKITEPSKVESEETAPVPQENVKKPDEKVEETSNNDESKVVEEKEQKETAPVATEVIESKENVPEDAKVEKESEKQVNGKATNGNSEINLNGDSSKDEELNARLSEENGKEIVNGSNGDAAPGEKQNEKVETDISEIKVKSVPSDEPRTDPIEQPTEA